VRPWRSISFATWLISSSDGVIRPDRPIMSAFSAIAVSRIFCAGTITPRSITSKLLQRSTTPTMFFPMSCTSPFTVAMTILPFERPASPVRAFSASMKGSSHATARFITRADLTTCGRNILPAPNRSPTTFMPSISGPSITSSGRAHSRRASSVSASTHASMPCTSACESLSRTGSSRHARFSAGAAPFFALKRSAIASSRSVASGRRLSTTSSTRSRSSGSRSSTMGSAPALTMPMSMPARIAWNRNTAWIAWRTVSLPRNENDTFDTPPDTWQPGRVALMMRVASMKSTA